jgi:hypothetical protein
MIDFEKSQYEYLDIFLKDKPYIYLTSLTKEFWEMGYNWVLSLKKIKQEHLSLIICLDEESYQKTKELNLNCVFLNVNIQKNNTMDEWFENEKNYKIIGPYQIAKNYNIDIIVSDTDIIFFKNPVEKLKQELLGYDFITISDKRFDPFLYNRKINKITLLDYDKISTTNIGDCPQIKNGIQNGCFSYLNLSEKKSKEKILNFYSVFVPNSDYYNEFYKTRSSKDTPEDLSLQSIVNYRHKQLNMKVKTLNCFEFVNGSVWKIPYLKEKIKDNCYLVHYNFCDETNPLTVKNDKIKWMKENNHWFL